MPALDPVPFAGIRTMLETAARAVGRIDRDGLRGLTTISIDEIDAMACTLAHLGLIPIPPGEDAPETLINLPQKEASDAQL